MKASPHSFARLANRAAGEFYMRNSQTGSPLSGIPEWDVSSVFGEKGEKSINRFGSRTGTHRYMDGEVGSTFILIWKEAMVSEGKYYGRRR